MTRAATFRAAAALGAMLLAALMIMTASRAAFTDTTDNSGNSWSAGTVVLDSAPVTALFTATGVAPGYTQTECIDVIYTGTLPSTAKLTSITGSGDAGLQANLDVTIDRWSGAGCTGTEVANVWTGDLATPVDGETAWAATNPTTYSYEITVSMDSAVTDNGLQGTTAGATFEWTATSN